MKHDPVTSIKFSLTIVAQIKKIKERKTATSLLQSSMARGRPRKQARNISGLRNQSIHSTVSQLPNIEPLVEPLQPPCDHINPASPERELGLHLDSTRYIIDGDGAGFESDSDVEELSLCGDWDDEELQESMFKLAVEEGDDPSDEGWLPDQLKRKKRRRTGEFRQWSSVIVDSHLKKYRAAKRVYKRP